MKKTFSILFILIFAYNLVGFYFVFEVKQHQLYSEIEQKVKNTIPEKKLVCLQFPLTEKFYLFCIKTAKEFRFNGEMYDVVKYKITGDYITCYCIRDFKENILFAGLEQLVKQNMTDNPQQKHNTHNLSKKINQIVFFHTLEINTIVLSSIHFNFQIFGDKYKSIILDKHTPPPQYL